MTKPPGPREQEEQKKIEHGIRTAARAGKAVLEQKVAATAERMKNKPAKKAKRK
jgi:hypothetical protein